MTEPPELSPEALAAIPEIAAFLRSAAEVLRAFPSRAVPSGLPSGLRDAANVLELEAGIGSFPTVGDE